MSKSLSITEKRPEELKRHLHSSEMQISTAKAHIQRVYIEIDRLSQYKLDSYDEILSISTTTDPETRIQLIHHLTRYNREVKQRLDNLLHCDSMIRMHLHNMRIIRKFMCKFDLDEYQFHSRLRRHDYEIKTLEQIHATIEQIHKIIKEQLELVATIREKVLTARHEKREPDIRIEYDMVCENIIKFDEILQGLKA